MAVFELIAVVCVCLGGLYTFIAAVAHFPRKSVKSEECYISSNGSGRLGQIEDESEVEISVIVPAYNEKERLPGMLTEAIEVLTKWGITWEIIVVDDGSTDGTDQVAVKFEGVRVCVLEKNRGKGGAVTHGIMRSRGKCVLFADADGASLFNDIHSLYDVLPKDGIAIGSRAHMVKSDAVVKRSFIRNFLMYSLHTLLYIFGIRSIADTQCGFKLFTRSAAASIFPHMHNEGWIFDVEILILAERKGISVKEVPISWHEVEGSKMELAKDSVKMAFDLVIIRFAYLFGVYRD
ncbi:nucleotide-diphospho-sugar transferase [Lipomyces arxii]|uniref:nucleotide-diphospho-sugar transferase n=1 Tax=Lipomyces arxii TaxID=56418 RepID=UPI0034CFE118